jgi:cell wall assembly regulator SMI1
MSLLTLEHWLQQHLPEVVADLAPPATDQELDAFAAHHQLTLPASLRALYRWHNGQFDRCCSGPFYGLTFLSLQQSSERLRTLSEQWERFPAWRAEQMQAEREVSPEGAIKPWHSNPRWIPFAHDFAGNGLAFDLDPGPSGTVGQVINYGPDEMVLYAIAPSLEAFLAWMLSELKAGNYRLGPDTGEGREFNTLEPHTDHFLASLPEMLARRMDA